MIDSTPVPKLTIELVPKTSWYSNVRSNVPTEYWDRIRKQVYLLANYVCEVCGGVGRRHPVECHEAWYYDDENHIQKLVRMVALCPDCHMVKHIGRASATGFFHTAVHHLSKVNGWDTDTSMRYCGHQMDKWKQRSRFEWKLDIDALVNYNSRGKLDLW